MTQEEYRKRLLEALARAKTQSDVRAVITEADGQLEASDFTQLQKRAFFDKFICEAQDNTATMQNAGAAQEIVNQVLTGK